MVSVLTGRSFVIHTIDTTLVPSTNGILVAQSPGEAPGWYALYTCSRHEKRVASQLAERTLEFFLPLYKSLRRWKDRSRVVQMPLFPGYVFVRIPLTERLRLLSIGGAVGLVGSGGAPQAVPDQEIQKIRQLLLADLQTEPYPYLSVGSPVRVIRGPLEGAEGYVLRCKKKCRVVISLHLIQRSIAVELDFEDLASVSHPLSRITVVV